MIKTVIINDQELTLTNYKEPLRAVEKGKGFGFYGALLSDVKGENLQCHLCGALFSELSVHIRMTHKISPRDYRAKFGIAIGTALISEKLRFIRKQKYLDWLKSLTPIQKAEYLEKCRIGREKGLKKIHGNPRKPHTLSFETWNKRGTCPDQILDKILEAKNKLGRTPSLREFREMPGGNRYRHLIFKVFGSWNNALKTLELENKSPFTYTDEALFQYMRNYTQKYNKIPTKTDFKRHLLPGESTYRRRFGSLPNARELAGVYDMLKK